MDSSGDESARWKGKHERKELRRPQSMTIKSEETNESTANPNLDTKPDLHAGSGDTDTVTRSGLPTEETNSSPNQLAQSSFNPCAAIFVPRSHIGLSPYAEPFIPSVQVSEFSSMNNEDVDDSDTSDYYVSLLQQLIYEVTSSPASFEREIRSLTTSLNGNMIESGVLKRIAEIIVNQGIQEPNFRYNAVRMCRHLSENLQNCNFRAMVLQACQEVSTRSVDLMSSPDGQAIYRGYALLLGEIFSQIQVGGIRLKFLGERIPEILSELLDQPSSDNLKSVCQVIKFVGAHLEDQERAANDLGQAPIMDKLITRIGDYAVTIGDTLDRCIKGMLLAVVELRTANFGRGSRSPPVTTQSFPTISVTTDPTRYGPDGQQLTAEEALFMDSVYNDVPNGDDYGYEDNCESEEMDDEMCTAFEEFLRNMPH